MIESKLIPLLLLPFSSRFPSLAQIRTIRGKDKAGKMAVHVHRYERKMIVLDYDLTPTHPMREARERDIGENHEDGVEDMNSGTEIDRILVGEAERQKDFHIEDAK